MSDLAVILGVATVGVAAVLIYLIRILFILRVEEMHTRVSELHERLTAKLSDEEVERLAGRIAERLDRRDALTLSRAAEDKKLLLDLARMSDDEFRVYRDQLRIEREGLSRERGSSGGERVS